MPTRLPVKSTLQINLTSKIIVVNNGRCVQTDRQPVAITQNRLIGITGFCDHAPTIAVSSKVALATVFET